MLLLPFTALVPPRPDIRWAFTTRRWVCRVHQTMPPPPRVCCLSRTVGACASPQRDVAANPSSCRSTLRLAWDRFTLGLRPLHHLSLSPGTGHMACPRVWDERTPSTPPQGVLPAPGTYTHTHTYILPVCTIPPVKTVLALGAVQREARWVKLV